MLERTDKPVSTPARSVAIPSQSLLRGKPYTNSASTDIRERFRVVREQQKEQTT